MKRKLIAAFLSAGPALLVAGIVLAATTIGTNISTDGTISSGGNTTISGNLSVTGTSTFTGAVSMPVSSLGGTKTLSTELNNLFSTGWISGGTVTDAGGGAINIAAGEGMLRATNSSTGALYYASWSALSGTSIPSGATRYVYVSYNSGSPAVVVSATNASEFQTNIYLAEVHYHSGVLDIHNDPRPAGDFFKRITDWASSLIGNRIVSGEAVSDPAPPSRKVRVTAGSGYDQHFNAFSTAEFNSNTGSTFTAIYRDGAGDFVRTTGQTQWDNTQYDNGTGTLATMTAGYYANKWVLRGTDGSVAVMYGRAEYATQAAAESESVPSTKPEEFIEHGFFTGQITFQKSGASPASITQLKPIIGSATVTGTSAGVSNHNDLGGLQGGTAGQYYHLTSAQNTLVAGITASSVELNYATGVTSAIQTQLNTKAPSASPTFTGNVNFPGSGTWNSSGNVGIGIATSTAALHIKAGTASAGTAPLKFTAGTNLTTPEAGAVEYDGSYLYLTDGATTRGASSLPAKDIYSGVTKKRNVVLWNGTATTSGGVATFYPTSDGTGTGTAIFTNIYSVQVTAANNTATAIAVPLASVKLIAADKKSVTANVITGTTATLGSPTVIFSADGTTVYINIIGD